jgi:serine/threonine-protein kinase
MITSSGLVKILDFGLAKLTERAVAINGPARGSSGTGVPIAFEDQATLTQAPLTTEGSILGTVNYMSPEQAEGKPVDARSDIFSFGAVLYEMTTGQRAFQGVSDIATLTAVLRDEVKHISEVAPEVPPELEQVISVCLMKHPDSRWQSMREVEMALSGLKRRSDAGVLQRRTAAPLSASPGTAAPSRIAPAPPTAEHATRIAKFVIGTIAAILMLIAALAAGWWWTRTHQPTPAPVATVQPPQAAKPSPISNAPVTPPVEQQVPETPAPAIAVPAPKQSSSAPIPPPVAPAPAITPAITPAPTPAPPAARPAQPRVAPQMLAVNIADGTPLRIALAEDVPVTAAEDKPLQFRVVEDLKVGNAVLVPKGAEVTGSIASEAGKKRFLGMGGKMTFQLDSVDAVDGHKLKVRASAGRKGAGPATRPIDTGKYAKAKNLAAARGTDYIAYIDGDQSVSVAK